MNAVLYVRDQMRALEYRGMKSMGSHQHGRFICIVYFDPRVNAWKLQNIETDENGEVQ